VSARGKAIYALTHTTCIRVDSEEDAFRAATEEEARVILDIVEESKDL
jgi:hypothetical protein